MKTSGKGPLARYARHQVRLPWIREGRRSPRGRRVALYVEKLESRNLLAGDLAATDVPGDDPAAGDDADVTLSAGGEQAIPPQVDLSLQLTALDGSPLTSLAPGQDFLLHVFAEDARAESLGVFSAFLDIRWDDKLAAVTGDPQYGADFPNVQSADTSLAGLVDEAGAVAGIGELGPGARELFSVAMRATAAGDLVFSSEPADTLPAHEVLAYGWNEAIPADDVHYGSVAISISAAAPKSAESGSEMAALAAAAATTTDSSAAAATSFAEPAKVDQALDLLLLGTYTPAIPAPPEVLAAATQALLQNGAVAGGDAATGQAVTGPAGALASQADDAAAASGASESADADAEIDGELAALL